MNPDYEIECYWLNFKQSMLNFYQTHKLLQRPIDKWSTSLNTLQALKQYSAIEKAIINYLTLYGIDVLRICDQYYINILITNLKRWDKIATTNKFYGVEKNLVIILLEIAFALLKSGVDIVNIGLFSDVELLLIYEDFSALIEFALIHNKISVLDKLLDYNKLNIINYLNSHYNMALDMETNISAKKIMKILTALIPKLVL